MEFNEDEQTSQQQCLIDKCRNAGFSDIDLPFLEREGLITLESSPYYPSCFRYTLTDKGRQYITDCFYRKAKALRLTPDILDRNGYHRNLYPSGDIDFLHPGLACLSLRLYNPKKKTNSKCLWVEICGRSVCINTVDKLFHLYSLLGIEEEIRNFKF